MRVLALAVTGVLICLTLCGCASGIKSVPSIQTHWEPWTNQVTSASQLAAALEARWTLGMIQAYCNAMPPTPDSIQNLVALGESWKGGLYRDKASGLDRIWW